jgi:hypothetical protein
VSVRQRAFEGPVRRMVLVIEDISVAPAALPIATGPLQ